MPYTLCMRKRGKHTVLQKAAFWFGLGGAFLLLSAALMATFSQFGAELFPAYRHFSRALMGGLAWICSVVPFSVWSYVVVLLVAVLGVSLAVTVLRRESLLRWLGWVFSLVAASVLFLVGSWGLNHYAPPLSDDLGLKIEEYSQEQLMEASVYCWTQAARLAPLVPRDQEGVLQRQDFDELATAASGCYGELACEYDVFAGSALPPKRFDFGGDLLLYWGNDGIFMPFTGEANVPPNAAVSTVPFNMCHEMAHRMGIAGEDEANFAAFLACVGNADVRFAYSGYYRAAQECYYALATSCPERLAELGIRVAQEASAQGLLLVAADSDGTAVHYRQYEGPLEEVGTAANDAYLKTFDEELGVQSYGAVTDYLIAWYLRR